MRQNPEETIRLRVEVLEMAESDFVDYLSNLEDYENHLARGEIRWQRSTVEVDNG